MEVSSINVNTNTKTYVDKLRSIKHRYSIDAPDEGQRLKNNNPLDQYLNNETEEKMRQIRKDMANKMTKGFVPDKRDLGFNRYDQDEQQDLVIRKRYEPEPDIVQEKSLEEMKLDYPSDIQRDSKPSRYDSNVELQQPKPVHSVPNVNFGDYIKESAGNRYSSDPELENELRDEPSPASNHDEEQSGSDHNEPHDDSRQPLEGNLTDINHTPIHSKPEMSPFESSDHLANSNQVSSSDILLDHEEYEGEGEEDNFPILFLDVNLGKDRVERLVIYDGDDPFQVANEFCEKNCLEEKKKRKLAKVIKKQLDSLLTRIEEDEDEEDSRS